MIKKLLTIALALIIGTPAFASVSFNGSNQNLHQSTGFTLGLTNQKQITMSAWIDIDGTGISQTKIFGKSTQVGGNQTFNFGAQDCGLFDGSSATNTLCLSMGMDNNPQNTFIVAGMTSSTVPLFGVHHVAIVWNNTSGTISDWTFYINDVVQTNTSLGTNVGNGYSTSTTIEDLASTIYIGSACGDTCPSEFLAAYITDIAAWTKALTSGEIATLYNGGIPAPCKRLPRTVEAQNLIMYFPLDDNLTGVVNSLPLQLGGQGFYVDQNANSATWSPDMKCGDGFFASNIKNGGVK